jgi:hypothetical protein
MSRQEILSKLREKGSLQPECGSKKVWFAGKRLISGKFLLARLNGKAASVELVHFAALRELHA